MNEINGVAREIIHYHMAHVQGVNAPAGQISAY